MRLEATWRKDWREEKFSPTIELTRWWREEKTESEISVYSDLDKDSDKISWWKRPWAGLKKIFKTREPKKEEEREKLWKSFIKTIPEDYEEPGVVGQFFEAFNQGVTQAAIGISRTIERTIGKYLGLEAQTQKLTDYFKRRLYENPEWGPPEDLEKWTDPRFYSRIVGGFSPHVIGSVGTALAMTIATGGNIPVGLAAGFGYAYAVEGGIAFDEAKSLGATDRQADWTRRLVGSVNAVLEIIPIGKLFSRLPGGRAVKRSMLKKITKAVVKQGAYEMTTEGLQEIVSNAALKTYDENINWFDNVDIAMVGGLMMGAPAGAAGIVIKESIDWVKPPLTRTIDTTEAKMPQPDEAGMVRKNKQGINIPAEITQGKDEGFIKENIEKQKTALKSFGQKFVNIFDIENRFRRLGAPGTGLAIKTLASKKVAGEEWALKEVSKTMQHGLTKEEFTDAAFATEQPKLAKTPQMKKVVEIATNFFDTLLTDLKRRGMLLVGFPESMTNRLGEELTHNTAAITSLQAEMKKFKPTQVKERAAFNRKIKNLTVRRDEITQTVKYLKEGNFKYVHMPVKFWLEDFLVRNKGQEMKILSSIPWGIYKRKAPTLEVLVAALEKAGLMDRSDVDLRDIMAIYGRYVHNKFAIDDIFKFGKKEGLATPLAEASPSQKEDWVKLPSWIVPEFRGWLVHPIMADMIEQNINLTRDSNVPISRVLGGIKMMQFYNPLFLPMYDVIQSVMLGILTKPHKLPGYIIKGIRDVKNKTPEYFQASRDGLFSKPFANMFDNYMKRLVKMKQVSENTLLYRFAHNTLISHVKHPVSIYTDIYTLSWNTAWKLDGMVRMMSYRHLLDRGYSSKDAAQQAARFHGDYASVPAKTRKTLNKIMFTPTFKIVMAKLYYEMVHSSYKVVTGRAGRKEYGYALGILMTASLWFGRDFFMRYVLGYEKDQRFRRYCKTYTTETGEKKQHCLTMSGPDIMLARYMHRYKQGPADVNAVLTTAKAFKWELHPLYQAVIEIATNQSVDFTRIYSPFDPKYLQAKDIALYGFRRLIRINELFMRDPNEAQKEKSFQIARKEMGIFWSTILKPFVFDYIRNTPDRAQAWKIRAIAEEFETDFIKNPPRTDKERQRRIDYFKEKLQEVAKRETVSESPQPIPERIKLEASWRK